MKLAALIDEKNVLIHTEATSMREALEQLVENLNPVLESWKPEDVLERLLDVEEEVGAMSLGNGVRIPHARLGGLNRLWMAIASSREGIPLDPEKPEDSERIHLIFLVLTPKTQSTLMLQTLASIARLVTNEENRKALVSTTSATRVLRILEETGIEVKKAVVAADLMNPVFHRAEPEMNLRRVVEELAHSGEEGIPLIDPKDNELIGDISSRAIVELGLPSYMHLISDPNVLSDFEPFEDFFKKEESFTAMDVVNREAIQLEPETPIEILAHRMLTTRSERAYIVADKKLLGVVYRKDIVRKVLYL